MRLLSLLVAATTGLAAAHFAPRPGWHAGTGRVHPCPGLSVERCSYVTSWAATVAWRDCAECLPHATVEALPPGGIAPDPDQRRKVAELGREGEVAAADPHP